jgi:hypothetical protein
MLLMENDDIAIEAIKLKVCNTLNLREIDPNVLGFVERKSIEDPAFRGHYYTPYELTAEVKLVENERKRSKLILWLKSEIKRPHY